MLKQHETEKSASQIATINHRLFDHEKQKQEQSFVSINLTNDTDYTHAY